MATPCANTTSSTCVSNQGKYKTEYENQTQINDAVLEKIADLFAMVDTGKLDVDGTEVNSSFTLINVLQYLLDESKQTHTSELVVDAAAINVAVDLKNLAGNCNNSSYTLLFIIQLLVTEITKIRSELNTIKNKLI
jgi:hypothetical protein